MKYDHQKIEEKWQKKWQEKGIYSLDLKSPKKKFYNLMMFPYPSAEGLHVGNMYAFTGADIHGRFKSMQGYEVFEPIGLDGFGIHSENYAIKIGKHPAEQAKVSEKRFYQQLSRIGNRFSWENKLETYDPEYYRWTQWLFVQMFKNGLAYRKKAMVNWCPSCKTVLADEQVEEGVCERCQTATIRRQTEQWFFRITKYAERLLKNIDKIDWPEKIKTAQRNWIGRKQGINITYSIKGIKETVSCFTTRPDTNFGATFVVVAPEYRLITKILTGKVKVEAKKKAEIKKYVDKALKKTEQQRKMEEGKKTGVFTGLYAVNHLNEYPMPIYVSDFVLMDVGTGAVVGVPGHDKRDFEFARAFKLPIKRVVVAADGDKSTIKKIEQVQENEGIMVNSGFLNGLEIDQAIKKMIDHIVEKGWGKRVVSYHLRDWLISRQRYWGPPIPMVKCRQCGWQSVAEKDLPVELPYVEKYRPTGDGRSPLARASKKWLETKCPKCRGQADRETDVSDTFLDSSWYFLRYPSTHSAHSGQLPFDKGITSKWLPVDAYIGGAEHAVLHLLYSRFITMALKDWGYLNFEEPFPFLYGHGLIIKDGFKMSKSRGNVVIPDQYIDQYGVDALRMYLMFIGPYDSGGDFNDQGMVGMARFLGRVWRVCLKKSQGLTKTQIKAGEEQQLLKIRHATIKRVTKAIEGFRYNVVIAALMEYVNEMYRLKGAQGSKEWQAAVKDLILMLAPIAPYFTEELWGRVNNRGELTTKNSIHQQTWPEYDQQLAQGNQVTMVFQVNGKLRGRIDVSREAANDKKQMLTAAKKNARVQKYITGKKLIKEIFVLGRLVNLVVK